MNKEKKLTIYGTTKIILGTIIASLAILVGQTHITVISMGLMIWEGYTTIELIKESEKK